MTTKHTEPASERAELIAAYYHMMNEEELRVWARKAFAMLSTDAKPVVDGELQDFEQWWKQHGQFCRAGGGEYEKTFAYRAWQAALLAATLYEGSAVHRLDDLVHALTGDEGEDDSLKVLERLVAELNGRTVRELLAATPAQQKLWCPDVCPFTGLPFFMWLEHHETGEMVPTYGGPFDSYTLPERDSDGDYTRERYDHDLGGWITDCVESLGIQIVSDQAYVYEEERPLPAATPAAGGGEAVAMMNPKQTFVGDAFIWGGPDPRHPEYSQPVYTHPQPQPEADSWSTQWRECAETICTIIGADVQVGNPSELLASVRRWSDERTQPEAGRVPLTPEKLQAMWLETINRKEHKRLPNEIWFGRQVEAAHGITAPKQDTRETGE